MKPEIWSKAGLIIIHGSSIDASPHSHHVIQLAWKAKDAEFKLNDKQTSSVVIIGSDIEHQLEMEEGWILLVEPTSLLGQCLSRKLMGNPLLEVPLSLEPIENVGQGSAVSTFLEPLFRTLELPLDTLKSNESDIQDHRIKSLLQELNQCFSGFCLKPNQWRAAEVAQNLALSESRFLHLFSQEMGISWRPYLLWCRMICAVRAILNGQSATEAAHLSGFSDSAHLSRTFRKNFGMTIREATKIFT